MKGAIATVILFIGIGIGHVVTKYIQPRHSSINIQPLGDTVSRLLRSEILRMPIKSPARYQELENCFINPIIINGALVSKSPFIFRVDATDRCKQSTREFKIKVSSKGNWNFYVLGSIALAGLVLGYTIKR